MLAEMVIEHLATESGIPADVIRQQNIYQEGDRTHFGEKLVDFNVPDLWRQIQTIGSVQQRREDIATFNAANKWRKRGLSVLPTKFGINFTAKFMNQVRNCKIYTLKKSLLVTLTFIAFLYFSFDTLLRCRVER